MHKTTPEITAYVAYWSVMNDQVNDLADEVQLFARQLQATEEKTRGVPNIFAIAIQTVCPGLPRIYVRCQDLLAVARLSLNGNSGLD